jgi:hypothetical protein
VCDDGTRLCVDVGVGLNSREEVGGGSVRSSFNACGAQREPHPPVLSESLLVAAISAPLIQMRSMGMRGEDGVVAGEGAGGWVTVAVLVGLVLCTKGLPQRGIVSSLPWVRMPPCAPVCMCAPVFMCIPVCARASSRVRACACAHAHARVTPPSFGTASLVPLTALQVARW